jgi:hypothetical protein
MQPHPLSDPIVDETWQTWLLHSEVNDWISRDCDGNIQKSGSAAAAHPWLSETLGTDV